MVWNPQVECMPDEERRKIQLERLQATVRRVYDKVEPLRNKMEEAGVGPDSVKSLEDIAKLPFTTKDDFRSAYPFGFFAVPLDDVVRIHSSSGTTGKPVVAGYTKNDIEIWAETMARTIGCAGGTKSDIIQIAYGYGLFTGGLGVHYGAEKIGCTVVPTSGGNTRRQLMLMQDFGTTLLACTPSYSLYMADEAADMGLDFSTLKLRAGMFGAEPWTNEIRKEIEERLSLIAIDIYGLTEVIGPGVSSECLEQNGLHVFDDHFYPEIINPETGEPLPPGELGELVFTSLTKEAFPIIRFRTRDITRLFTDKCPCGRTSIRMERISGRTDDMLIIRGVNVFPSQIESVLMSIEGTEPHYLIVVDRVDRLDQIEVQVEVRQEIFSDEVRRLEDFQEKIAHEINSNLGVHAKVKLVEPKTIERSMGKAKRVIDKRKES